MFVEDSRCVLDHARLFGAKPCDSDCFCILCPTLHRSHNTTRAYIRDVSIPGENDGGASLPLASSLGSSRSTPVDRRYSIEPSRRLSRPKSEPKNILKKHHGGSSGDGARTKEPKSMHVALTYAASIFRLVI